MCCLIHSQSGVSDNVYWPKINIFLVKVMYFTCCQFPCEFFTCKCKLVFFFLFSFLCSFPFQASTNSFNSVCYFAYQFFLFVVALCTTRLVFITLLTQTLTEVFLALMEKSMQEMSKISLTLELSEMLLHSCLNLYRYIYISK